MRFNFWRFAIAKDDWLLSMAEFLMSARHLWGWKTRKWRALGKKIINENSVAGGEIMVVLNGPSSGRQPLERLAGKDVMFVNQGFRHPKYKQIHPKYHVFIDTKLVSGVWDIAWIDEILSLVPDITFVMPAEWAGLPKFKFLTDRNIKVLWIGGHVGGIRGIGVSGECFSLAFKLGYKKIFFTGFEATSFPAALLKESSHFYGSDSDECLDPTVIETAYYFNLRQYRELNLLAARVKKAGLEMINLTDGGLLNMFPRMQFEEAFPAQT